MLHVKAKVTNENDTDLAAGAAVGPVNLFLHSLFSQVDISLNGTLITSSTNTYPYQAMIETLLSYGMDAKTSQLTSALYYKDKAGNMFARKVKVMPSVFLAHTKAMEQGTAKYPIRHMVCKSFTIPQNYLDMNHEKLFSGQLPTRIVVGLVDNRSFNGSRDRNPFNFANFNLHEIGLYLDRQQQHALRPIQPNFATGEYIRAYNTIFAGMGKLGADEGLFITRDEYANGYSLYAFDLTADLGEDDHFSLVRQGSIRLALKFSRALEATVTVIAYAEFENVIEINRNRNGVFDFAV